MIYRARWGEFLIKGRSAGYSEQTWLELLLVKHTLIAAERMLKEDDSISAMIDNESSFPRKNWDEDDDD